MSSFVDTGHTARGPVPYWLGQGSKGAHAKERLTKLHGAIKALAPSYEGLENAFDEHLGAHYSDDADLRRRMVNHLKRHWFSDGPEAYFRGQKVTQKYAEAVLKTIELSLNGKDHPVPINAWWIINPGDKTVKMLKLAEVDRNGKTVSSSVTLLIMTPRPPGKTTVTKTSLWGDSAAWETDEHNGHVVTRQVEKDIK